jgi:hypothetical protein
MLDRCTISSAARGSAQGDECKIRVTTSRAFSYNWALRILLRTQVHDNLGGYFTIRRSVLQDIPFDTVFQGYGEYFFRLLYHLQRQERTLVEIPAVYLARTAGQSKSRFLTMLVRYSWAAIELRRKVPRFKKASS